MLGQEHRINKVAVHEARIWAKSNGWQAFFADCFVSEKGGRSAGVFIFAKAHLQAWLPDQGGHEFWKHRGLAVIIKGGGLGPVLFCSCYFFDNSFAKTKAIPANLRMLAGLASYVNGFALPVCIGGDWNMEPDIPIQSGFPSAMQWHVKCVDSLQGSCVTKGGTSRSMLDYFLVSSMPDPVVEDVSFCPITFARPHKPVYLQFCSRPKNVKALVIKETKRIPVDPPFGHVVPPPGLGRRSPANC